MLRTKIVICGFLCVFLVIAGAILHHGIKKERYPYYMRMPIPEGQYRVYNEFDPRDSRYSYLPYLPREYVRIIEFDNADAAAD